MIFKDNFAWNCSLNNLIYIAIKLTSEIFYILVFNGKEMIFFFFSESADPVCLSPHFRLLRMCEQRQNGNMDNIDALLGKS